MPDGRLNEYDESLAGISRVHGPLPSRTATKYRGREAVHHFHLMLPVDGGITWICIVTVWSPCADEPRIAAVYTPLGAPMLRMAVFTVLPVVALGVVPRNSVGGSPVTESATEPVKPGFRLIEITGK